MKKRAGPIRPATLRSMLAAHLRLIVRRKACRHQVEPDVAEQVQRYRRGDGGAGLGGLPPVLGMRFG